MLLYCMCHGADAKTFWCQCAVPSIFIIWGMIVTNYQWWTAQPEYYFTVEDWILNPSIEEGGTTTIPYNAYNNETRPSYYQSFSLHMISKAFFSLCFFDANYFCEVFSILCVLPLN